MHVIHASPPTKTPRARRHDQNAQRILETAMRMVEEGGPDALSINKLADAVDFTPGALYRYVESKDALLSQIVDRILHDVGAHIAREVERIPRRASPLARVLAMVRGYRAFAHDEPNRFAVLATTMALPRVLLEKSTDAAPVVATMLATLSPLAEALDEAARTQRLEPGDASERAVCLFALLQGVLQLHKQARYAPDLLDLEKLCLHGTRALLVGWGATPRAVDAAIAQTAVTAQSPDPSGGSR